jgi:tetratricopeptide (TPR) repeat protein
MAKPTLTLALLALSCVLGCGGSASAKRDQHLARGDRFLADNKLAEATLEYKLAVTADQRSGPARQKLGDAYLRQKDYPRAFSELVRAADLLPTDIEAQLRAGRALLLANQFDDARGRAEKVLSLDPRNIEARILKGNALASLKDLPGALAQVQEAIQTDPTQSASYSHLGALQYAHGDLPQAEAAFKQALRIDPKSSTARLALANLYWSTNRHREAEEMIKEAAAMDPSDLRPNKALALLYLGTGRVAQAEEPLKRVAEHSTGFDGKIMLADYYVNVRRLPEAQAIYETVAATPDGAPAAKLRLAALGLTKGDRAGAYRLVDEILKTNPKHVEALVARAQLQFGDGKAVDGLASARSAVAADSNSALAHFVLGQILASQYQMEDAEAAFKVAVRVSQFAPANVELARMAIRSGKYADAVRYAQAAVDRVPGYGEAHLLLARAQIANGNPSGADAPIRLMVANYPDVPAVQAELGRLLLAKSDAAGAAAAFTRALSKDPEQVGALEGLVVLEVQQKHAPAARKRLDAAVAAAPKNGELQLMAARLYGTAFADLTAAESSVKRALAADANNLAAFDLLARIYVEGKNLPGATTEFEKLAQREPKSVANQTAVGVLYQLQNRLDESAAAYQRALALDPRAAVAANNLAQLYLDRNQNLEIALQLAQTAKAGFPTAHEVDDTLGWAYYKKGLSAQAVGAMKTAAAAQPNNAIYLYHLGAAYALGKDKINARQNLEKALKLQANFPGADDARKILASLN